MSLLTPRLPSPLSLCLLLVSVVVVLSTPSSADLVPGFRPPAIPLFAFSPALHAWTRSDRLTDVTPTHWFIGQNSTLTGYLRVDGRPFRFLGVDSIAPPFSRTLAGDALTDRPGQDLPSSPVKLPPNATAIDCAALCTLEPACLSWSFLPYNATSGPCSQPTATCSLRSSAGASQPDQCRASGLPPLHWNATYTDGVPSTDRSGNDLREFDAPSDFTPRDCAKACWDAQGCGAFVFAHSGCDDRGQRTHCWLKGTPIPSAGRSGDCRQAGLGPAAAGWYPPEWRPATPVLPQTAVRVQPTQTVVEYATDAIALTLTFTQPAFPHDAFASSREHVYVTAEVRSRDGAGHEVQLYLDAGSDLVASYPSSPDDAVSWEDVTAGLQRNVKGAHGYRVYVHDAKQFGFNGDSTRPNWGQLYFATDSPRYVESTAAAANITRTAFLQRQPLPPFDTRQPRVSLGAAEMTPVMAIVLDLSINATAASAGVLTLFYDEVATIEWFGTPLLPYWKHQYNNDPILATGAALRDYADIRARADAYDAAVVASVGALAGDKYATLLALAHREVTGASTVVWNAEKQTPWWFIKEMSTGGAMSTVDVLFPGAPLYIALAPEALKLMLWPILSWSNNETNDKVTISWAPHDLGGYPIANADAAHQEEMPLESVRIHRNSQLACCLTLPSAHLLTAPSPSHLLLCLCSGNLAT